MPLLDLARQVKGILPVRFGGTGNVLGWTQATVVPYVNTSGATLPLGTAVEPIGNGGARVQATTGAASLTMIGIVVGYYSGQDGTTLVRDDCPDQGMAAIMTHGRCLVLLDDTVAAGDFAFTGSTPGEIEGDSTVAAGAFGIFESQGTPGDMVYCRLFGAPVFGAGGGASPLTTKGDIFGYDTANARIPVGSNGQVLTADSSDAQGVIWAPVRRLIPVTFNAPTGGQQTDLPRLPWAGTIVRWVLMGDASGSIVIDIWKDTYANAPPTIADTITAASKPTLSSAQKNQDTTLSGWTTSFAAGDVLRFNVDSASGLTRAVLALEVTTP